MAAFLELTSQSSPELRWFLSVEAIAFVRRKGTSGEASVLLTTGGTIEPVETYTEIINILESLEGVA